MPICINPLPDCLCRYKTKIDKKKKYKRQPQRVDKGSLIGRGYLRQRLKFKKIESIVGGRFDLFYVVDENFFCQTKRSMFHTDISTNNKCNSFPKLH